MISTEKATRAWHPALIVGLLAFILEAVGVASGAYKYGAFPLQLFGVPLFIPILWILVTAMAYSVSERYGTAVGILSGCSLDLILEPYAHATGLWTWLKPFTPQIYFGSTIDNALVWAGMCHIGIKLWEEKR